MSVIGSSLISIKRICDWEYLIMKDLISPCNSYPNLEPLSMLNQNSQSVLQNIILQRIYWCDKCGRGIAYPRSHSVHGHSVYGKAFAPSSSAAVNILLAMRVCRALGHACVVSILTFPCSGQVAPSPFPLLPAIQEISVSIFITLRFPSPVSYHSAE